MILSMTGYGKGRSSGKGLSAEVEIKSVNSRYLEVYLKYPSSLANREYEIRELVKSKIKRGKINLIIQLKKNGNGDLSVSLDEQKLKNYLVLIKKIKKTAKITEKIKLEHILNSRDLFASTYEDINDDEFQLVKKAINSALDSFIKMKKNEGLELQKDLVKRIKSIEKTLNKVAKESSSSVNENFIKYKDRINNLLEGNTSVNSERLETELAIIADKADITEECIRLKSHLKFFLESLEKEEDPGRKLNFLCQEMHRETNTISSKTLSTTITHNTVFMKEEIERIREQIQNID